MLEIEFSWINATFNVVTIYLSQTNVKVKFYLQVDPTTRTKLSLDPYTSIFTSGVKKSVQLLFYPLEVQEAKLFEYLVFYPFFATFVRNDSDVSSYTPQFLLRKAGYNKDYFSDWPTGDAPFVIKYFENMASYIQLVDEKGQ